MKFECPNCHITGQAKDEDIPLEGRLVICPKCATSFQIKPPPKKWNPYMMNTCPKCAYSTFSEQTFAVCPKCGLDGEQHHLERQRQAAAEKSRRAAEATLPPPEPLPVGSKYGMTQPQEEAKVAPKANVSWPVQAIGLGFIVVALASLIWGGFGLHHYYGKDWIKEIYEETGDQVTGSQVFFKYGFFPWIKVLFGVVTLVVAVMFLQLKRWSLEKLEWCAWALLLLLGGNEIWQMITWFRHSSSNPSFFYYLTGVADGLLMTALWTAVVFAGVWALRHDEVVKIFRKFGSD